MSQISSSYRVVIPDGQPIHYRMIVLEKALDGLPEAERKLTIILRRLGTLADDPLEAAEKLAGNARKSLFVSRLDDAKFHYTIQDKLVSVISVEFDADRDDPEQAILLGIQDKILNRLIRSLSPHEGREQSPAPPAPRTIVISYTGMLWSPDGGKLPRAPSLGPAAQANLPTGDQKDHVTVHLGRRGAVQLLLGERPITQACFERIVWLLVVYRVERAVIKGPGGREALELLSSQRDIVATLAEIGQTTTAPYFRLESLALERVKEGRRLAFRKSLDAWVRARGRLTNRQLNNENGKVDNNRTLLRVQPDGRLMSYAVSDLIRAYLPCQRMNMLGQEVENQPDRFYGESLALSYRDLWLDEEPPPRFQEVETVVDSAAEGKSIRVGYERLLLPWHSRGGDRWISSEPVLRFRHPCGVDLRSIVQARISTGTNPSTGLSPRHWSG